MSPQTRQDRTPSRCRCGFLRMLRDVCSGGKFDLRPIYVYGKAVGDLVPATPSRFSHPSSVLLILPFTAFDLFSSLYRCTQCFLYAFENIFFFFSWTSPHSHVFRSMYRRSLAPIRMLMMYVGQGCFFMDGTFCPTQQIKGNCYSR